MHKINSRRAAMNYSQNIATLVARDSCNSRVKYFRIVDKASAKQVIARYGRMKDKDYKVQRRSGKAEEIRRGRFHHILAHVRFRLVELKLEDTSRSFF